MSNHKPVLIFNSVQQITLAVARSLHRRGIPVTFADIGAVGACPASRAIRNSVELPQFQEQPDEFIDQLIQLVRSGGYDAIFPCSDAGLAAIGEHYERLAPLVYTGCPAPDVVRRVLDKQETFLAARRVGIDLPVTHEIADSETLDALRPALNFPIIAKPRSKRDERRHTFKVRYFATFADLRDAFLTDSEFGVENLLQEYCPGEGVGIEVLMHRGEPLALFQHRRLKELPISGGGSVLSVSEPLNTSLVEAAIALLRKIEWQGVAMVEFRWERFAKRAHLMEVNGRYWGSLPLAIHSGVDFPFYEWQLAHGQQPTIPRSYRTGLRMHWLSGDVRRLASLWLEKPNDGFPLPPRWAESVRFVKDLVAPAAPALFAWNDPKPAIAELKQAVRPIFVRSLHKVKTALKCAIANFRYLGARNAFSFLTIRALYALRIRSDRGPSDFSRFRSILFVCHGNKIRSAMAEALLRKHFADQELKIEFEIASAALISHVESCADRRLRLIAADFGVSLDNHKPRNLTAELVDHADVIFIMDNLNEARMRVRYPQALKKTFYLGTLFPTDRKLRNAQIPDPDRGSVSDIRVCCRVIDGATAELEEKLRAAYSESFGGRLTKVAV